MLQLRDDGKSFFLIKLSSFEVILNWDDHQVFNAGMEILFLQKFSKHTENDEKLRRKNSDISKASSDIFWDSPVERTSHIKSMSNLNCFAALIKR